MSEANLKELRLALERKGWKILAEYAGNDRDVSATWEIGRSREKRTLYIDFEGLDDLQVLPLSRSYGCHVRGQKRLALYFRKPAVKGTKRGQLWKKELTKFVKSLDHA